MKKLTRAMPEVWYALRDSMAGIGRGTHRILFLEIDIEKGATWRYGRLEINLSFLWYDFWIGGFWDTKKRILYINPLPCVVFRFRRIDDEIHI